MSIPPAFLISGSEQDCVLRAYELIVKAVCPKQGCYECVECKALLNKQHHLLRWLSPDTSYTLAHLEEVFKCTSFVLQQNEHFFIVFERADLFNQATANSLLKLLEEPPVGYHFILLSSRTDGVLPTIASRCIIEQLSYNEEQIKHPLYRFFTEATLDALPDFTKELERQKGLERDVLLLLDQLTLFWHHQKMSSGNISTSYKGYLALESLLQEARLKAPLAGNAKIFFKNLYLQFLGNGFLQKENKL